MFRRFRCLSLVAGAALALGATACSDDPPTVSASVQVSGAWARTSPMMVSVGAAYFQITSPVDDRLVAAAVDPSIAAMVEIHETVHSEQDHSTMTMREMTDGLPLPAGDTVSLEPGGYHVMLMELAEPLAVGDTFDLVLTLETAGDVPVTVEVRDSAPAMG
jgi:periplasmic copper chaperone A